MPSTKSTTFDLKALQQEATKGLYAYAGVTDLAVEVVRDYVAEVQARLTGAQKDVTARFADVQKQVADFDFEPQALRAQATKVWGEQVEALTQDAKARRAAIEKRVAELQAEARKAVDGNVASVTDTYEDLAKRGESLVKRIRNQESTKATVKSAKTTAAKAKTTRTQAEKAAKKNTAAAKKSATARKTAAKKSAAPAKASAKATATSARKTAANAAKAVVDAAEKIGD